MHFLFFASEPCALKIDGEFFGVVDTFPRAHALPIKENAFVEFLPEYGQPLCFFIGEHLRFHPPKGVDVYLLPNAVALFAHGFFSVDTALRPLFQRRFDEGTMTLFTQGIPQLCLDTTDGFFVRPLPKNIPLEDVDLGHKDGVFFIKTAQSLLLFDLQGNTLFDRQVINCTQTETGFNATLPLCNRQNDAEKVRIFIDRGKVTTEVTQRVSPANLPHFPSQLRAYAFFEKVLLGEPFEDDLGENLKAKASILKAFLGNFIAVEPTDTADLVWLIYQKKERLYEVKSYAVEWQEGKIYNVVGR